jgi:hypothetical protein
MKRVKVKARPKTKKVYYAIVEVMAVPIDATDADIDNILMDKATNNGTLTEGKDYMWSYNDDLLYDSYKYI